MNTAQEADAVGEPANTARTLAQCDFGLALEFFDSATRLCELPTCKWLPAYFLICHSLELYLKAHLRYQGYDNTKLKKLSHDLIKCLAAAEKLGLKLNLSELQKEVFCALAKSHGDTSLRYRIYKTKTFPPIDDSLSLVKFVSERVFSMITAAEFTDG